MLALATVDLGKNVWMDLVGTTVGDIPGLQEMGRKQRLASAVSAILQLGILHASVNRLERARYHILPPCNLRYRNSMQDQYS
jgi:hypothetical protein